MLTLINLNRYEFGVQDGDVIIMATDGIFDNVPDSLLVAEINTIQGSTDPAKIQVRLFTGAVVLKTFFASQSLHSI